MDSIITNFLAGVRFGVLQTHNNMSVLPIFTASNNGPDYVTLKEALEQNHLTITEVDASGAVPELKVSNPSEYMILLLDGEELMGAKQNRVLNSSILLGKKTKTTIPVSCTEQGRWAYTSTAFAYSNTFASHSLRSDKLQSVTSSLIAGRGHTSDQGGVWDSVANMHHLANTTSPTGAMRDAYLAKNNELNDYLNAFAVEPQQQGSLIFINGKVVGVDIISRDTAYQTLHPQLIKSYAMDALLQNEAQYAKPDICRARTFLRATTQCKTQRFNSVGQGYDYRFEGTRIVGSALVFQQCVIHLAFFCADQNKMGRKSGLLQHR